MAETIQYRQIVNLEYKYGVGQTRMNLGDSYHNYYVDVDEIELNPKIVDISNLSLKKGGLELKFSTPIICNVREGRYSNTMLCGVKVMGEDKDKFVEVIAEDLKTKFGPMWEERVKKLREEVEERWER